MKIKQLVEVLKNMPPDADVMHLWDGAARTSIEHVWLSKAGYVVTADFNKVCHYIEDQPINVPDNCGHDGHWRTPKKPGTDDEGK